PDAEQSDRTLGPCRASALPRGGSTSPGRALLNGKRATFPECGPASVPRQEGTCGSSRIVERGHGHSIMTADECVAYVGGHALRSTPDQHFRRDISPSAAA